MGLCCKYCETEVTCTEEATEMTAKYLQNKMCFLINLIKQTQTNITTYENIYIYIYMYIILYYILYTTYIYIYISSWCNFFI